MPEHSHYEDRDLFNPETHHEQSDVPVRPLLWFIVIFIVFSFVSYLVVLFLYKAFVKAERNRMDPPQTAVSRPADAAVPQNQPLLQPFPRVDPQQGALPPQSDTPVTDMQKMRAAEDQVLRHYGWVDKQRGIVHIPINEAKAIMAARLAVQGQLAGAAPAAPAVAPAQTATRATAAPSGQPVPPDTGTAPAATTGAHQ